MNIDCKVNTKANPIKSVKYVFSSFGNKEESADDQAYVMVKHLTPKSLNKYLNLSVDNQGINPCEVFMGQVQSVHNVHNKIIGRDMTKEEIVESEANKITMALVNEVFAYLLNETKLDKEEEKN